MRRWRKIGAGAGFGIEVVAEGGRDREMCQKRDVRVVGD